MKLQIERLTKRYYVERDGRQVLALSDVSLSVPDGEFLAIVGPSGCGKTTLLNIVAGLLAYDRGTVAIDGSRIDGPGIDRSVVFQNASLLPWRTIAGNVRYGMELQKRFDRQTMSERTEYFVKLVGLAGFERHYPSELSGGMQQRVNLARALASDPSVLLMDEPFAALDAQTRELMQAELLKIWTAARKTVVFITHQINEALYLADRVVGDECASGPRQRHFRNSLPTPAAAECEARSAVSTARGRHLAAGGGNPRAAESGERDTGRGTGACGRMTRSSCSNARTAASTRSTSG